MKLEELKKFCLSLKGAEVKMPFDDSTLAFTVKGKMFCLTDIVEFQFINLKCDPEQAIELREKYDEVTPGYYMNKNHWNSVKIGGKVTETQIKKWIIDSYNLVVSGLSKKLQKELE